jgi:chorismate lyase / 3-hydroxybenzoate synthase
MSDRAVFTEPAAAPRFEYRRLDPAAPLPPALLAAVTFGEPGTYSDELRHINVGLAPLRDRQLAELWHGNGPVTTGREGFIRYAADPDHLFGIIELDERRHAGIAEAAEAAYAAIRHFLRGSGHPHLLRTWNHFNDINGGFGDRERYRQFCIGRAAGMGDWLAEAYPAATAIGRRDGDPTLQIYWLSGRVPGIPLQNPRQVNPYRYPRRYGPAAPQFSRAMLVAEKLLMISGTASIVGHASHHREDARAQLAETLANLDSLLQKAASTAPQVPPRLGPNSLLKIYVRDRQALTEVETMLQERFPGTPRIILAGDICRRDLLIEADCMHSRSFAS